MNIRYICTKYRKTYQVCVINTDLRIYANISFNTFYKYTADSSNWWDLDTFTVNMMENNINSAYETIVLLDTFDINEVKQYIMAHSI